MIMIPEAKNAYYSMMSIKEIETLLEYAKKNLEQTKNDRVIVITHKNGVASTLAVSNVDKFFEKQREHQPKDFFDRVKDGSFLESKVLFDWTKSDFLEDITDYDCW